MVEGGGMLNSCLMIHHALQSPQPQRWYGMLISFSIQGSYLHMPQLPHHLPPCQRNCMAACLAWKCAPITAQQTMQCYNSLQSLSIVVAIGVLMHSRSNIIIWEEVYIIIATEKWIKKEGVKWTTPMYHLSNCARLCQATAFIGFSSGVKRRYDMLCCPELISHIY